MTGTPFAYTPRRIRNVTGFSIPKADIVPFLPTQVEPLATAQWLFGDDNTLLEDTRAARRLTAVPGALTDHSLVIVNAAGNGQLLTDIDEQAEQTQWVVFRKFGGGALGAVMGQWPGAGDDYGSLLYYNTASYQISTKGIGEQIISVPGAIGDWVFVGVSLSATGRIIHVGNVLTYTADGVRATEPGHPLVWGSVGGLPLPVAGLEIATGGISNRALSAEELTDVYLRAKATLAERGVALI